MSNIKQLYCGHVNASYINQTVKINGWVKRVRKMGNLVFVDIKDRYGLVQAFATSNDQIIDQLNALSREDVISLVGVVLARKQVNSSIPTGEVEILATSLIIHSKSKTPPLIIEDKTDANEEVRLKYRYLDLRRDVNLQTFVLRSKVTKSIRDFLHNQNFIETETPMLAKPTPEGARDYYVPTRTKKFYALPQSPQTFKQLLMLAGFDRYFQIAKCFRDEDLRSDRQPEFSQVDMELSFVDQYQVQTLVEQLLHHIFLECANKEIKIPFDRMDYKDAIHYYGTDKPDLRYGLKINDGCAFFKDTTALFIKKALENKAVVRYLFVEDVHLTKKQIQGLEKYAKDNQAKGLGWVCVQDNKVVDGWLANIIDDHHIYLKIAQTHNKTKGTILIVADQYEIATQALGAVRVQLATLLDLKANKEDAFVWIVNWPLFEYDQDNKQYVAAHHPFTAPTIECEHDFDTNQSNAKGQSYDVVLNGYELGGGSVRIINPEIQQRMFNAINMPASEAKTKFGFLLEAFSYGVPPHAGIALGLDRLMMILINSEMIKDVVAFPKNNAGVDMMLDCPSEIDDSELKEVGLKRETKQS